MSFVVPLSWKNKPDSSKKRSDIRVNLFPHEFRKLAELGAVSEVQNGAGIYYLDAQYYSHEFGWTEDIVNPMETRIC